MLVKYFYFYCKTAFCFTRRKLQVYAQSRPICTSTFVISLDKMKLTNCSHYRIHRLAFRNWTRNKKDIKLSAKHLNEYTFCVEIWYCSFNDFTWTAHAKFNKKKNQPDSHWDTVSRSQWTRLRTADTCGSFITISLLVMKYRQTHDTCYLINRYYI